MSQAYKAKRCSEMLCLCVVLTALALANCTVAFADAGEQFFVAAAKFQAQKQPELALDAANQAIRLSPNNARYYWMKSANLRELDEPNEALKAINIIAIDCRYFWTTSGSSLILRA